MVITASKSRTSILKHVRGTSSVMAPLFSEASSEHRPPADQDSKSRMTGDWNVRILWEPGGEIPSGHPTKGNTYFSDGHILL